MRLTPRSLFGRLLLLLVLGLVLVQIVSIGMLLGDRGRVLHRAVGTASAQRIAAVVHLLEARPAAERARLARALDLPPTRIRLDLPWQEAGGQRDPHGALLTTLLHEALGERRPVSVTMERAPPRPWRYRRGDDDEHRWRPARERPQVLLVQVGLADGGVVSFQQRLPPELGARPYRLLLALLLLVASVMVLSVVAVRYLTRPLDRLARAATELGRDINRPPLPETGPVEVRRAARAFNTMQTRLARYIADRSRILAAVSHDLKTPIARLRLRAEMLDDGEARAKIQADLEEMQAMVQATLDFMRGTEHAEAVAPVDLGALLEGLQEDAAEAGHDVTLQGRPHSPYPGRPLALKRCLSNLLDNAIRHGGRAVTLAVEDGTERLLIRVQDRGPGIPAGELERVFEPFYRLEGSRARHTGGTGLGLGIARNIARAHGGDLTLANRAGGGAEAVLELPR